MYFSPAREHSGGGYIARYSTLCGGVLPKSAHSEGQSCVVRPDRNTEICPLLRVVEARHPGGLPRGHDEVTKIIRELERVEIKAFQEPSVVCKKASLLLEND